MTRMNCHKALHKGFERQSLNRNEGGFFSQKHQLYLLLVKDGAFMLRSSLLNGKPVQVKGYFHSFPRV